jgi:effector-binding domain-containing protein
MIYTVEMMQVEARPIAVVKRRASLVDLPIVIPDACGEVWQFIRAHQIGGTGRNVAVYFDEAINIECGVEVPPSFGGGGKVLLSATPAGTVAHTEHLGPYHLLGQAHQAIRSWCAGKGRTLSGRNWEIYGHWNDDPSKLSTDVFYLLA